MIKAVSNASLANNQSNAKMHTYELSINKQPTVENGRSNSRLDSPTAKYMVEDEEYIKDVLVGKSNDDMPTVNQRGLGALHMQAMDLDLDY